MKGASPTIPLRSVSSRSRRLAPQREAATVKLIAEYLERAHQFERLAAHETDPRLKAELEKLASAYQKLAAKQAKEAGLPLDKHQPTSK